MSKKEKEEKQNEEPESKRLSPPKSIFAEYLESFVVTLIMALFGMTFIIQAVTVPTGSMQNTILIGDYLLVNKFIFNAGGNPLPFLPQRDIRRGDVIVFKYPGYPPELATVPDEGGPAYRINFVKRVIGLPGDTVEVRGAEVYVNGELLPEHRIIGESPAKDAALETREFEDKEPGDSYSVYYKERWLKFGGKQDYNFASEGSSFTVPENSYFVMGDSRNESLDSRYWGVVPRELIIGRAMIVYWSCDRAASNGSFLGCVTNPRIDRIGTLIR